MRALRLRRPTPPAPLLGRIEVFVVRGRHERLREAHVALVVRILGQRLGEADRAGVARDADDERGEDSEGEEVGREEVRERPGGLVQGFVVVLHEQEQEGGVWGED